MEALLQNIVNWVRMSDEHIIIGISGHGAAGKTTFADKVVNSLNPRAVNYLNTDPYIISSNVRKHANIEYTYKSENHFYKMTACHPSAHHLPSLERDVQMIKDGLDLFTIDTHNARSKLISSRNNVTIVEGMSVAFINPDLFDLKIYFYTDGETELRRRSDRDVVERGTDLHYLRQSHEERRIQYEVLMHPYSQQFDIIINSSDHTTRIEKNSFDFKCKCQ